MGAVAAVARAMGGGGNSAPGVPADRLAPVRGWTLAILPNLHCAPRRSSPRCAAAPRQSRVLPPLELLQPHSTPSTPLRGLDHQMLLPDAPIAAPRRHGAILRVAARDARSLGASPGVLAPQAAPIGGSLCVGKTLLRRLDGVGYLVEAYLGLGAGVDAQFRPRAPRAAQPGIPRGGGDLAHAAARDALARRGEHDGAAASVRARSSGERRGDVRR